MGLSSIRRVSGELRRDVQAVPERDPAATGGSTLEILTGWPGLHALLAHRVAHALDAANVPAAPRAIAYLSRALTGVEIHPAARIGDGLFIDHGMGVVIGETAQVGDNVTLYQGVTLGGTGFEAGKRHPTVQDNVTIGSGAELLGPITIGHGAKIGANTVVIHEVPPNSTVVGNPGHPVRVEGRRPEGPDADWVHLPDPIADALKQLSLRIAELERELAALRGEDSGPADVVPLRRIHQVLEVSGRTIDVQLEVTRYEPPAGAETRFSTNGIDVVNGYRLEAAGTGTRLTQSLEAKPKSLGARMLAPAASAQDVIDRAAESLRSDPVYVDPRAQDVVSPNEADEIRARISDGG